MMRALVYLQITSLKNVLQQRARRLRQPRYLFGALAGGAYLYFFIFRHVFGRTNTAALENFSAQTAELSGLLELVGAFLLFAVLAMSWIVPSARAALAFSEAEVAFLFPAPISRRNLIHFKLIKSQFAILLTSLILSAVTRRWAFLGGPIWIHAVGWWLIFSFVHLHLMAASFTRERLIEVGVSPLLRRMIALGILGLLAVVTLLWIRKNLPPPLSFDLSDLASVRNYAERVLAAPPLAWLLWPFRWVVRPFFATNLASFATTLGPTLLLIATQYLWVTQSETAFEEASLNLARRRTEVLTALRSGDWRSAGRPRKSRREPFRLGPAGWPVLAFLWKSLIAAGPPYYPQWWLMVGAIFFGAETWLLSQPEYQPFAKVFALGAATIAAYSLLLGPLLMRRSSQRLLASLDVLKAYPLRGWQVVLGELLSAVVLLTVVEWILLALLLPGIRQGEWATVISPVVAGTGAVSLGLIIPPLGGLMFAINFFAVLCFPSWSSTGQQGPGIEKMGQRLIFFGGYLVVLLVSIAPAAILGTLVFLVTRWISDSLSASLAVTGLVAAGILVAEFSAVIWWLGRRFEAFDLSAEISR